MNPEPHSLCITCGQEVGDPPRLNRLENGLPCPSCRDRILAFLPPALPGPGSLEFKPSGPKGGSKELSGQLGSLYTGEFGDSDEPA